MKADIPEELTEPATPFSLQADGPWIAPVQMALATEAPIWSDDYAFRRMLRAMGINTFISTSKVN